MSQISNNFYNHSDAMAAAQRIANDRRGTVYLVAGEESPHA